MSTVVLLASGPITTVDQLSVELVDPIETPTVVLIRWPGGGAPTVCQPARFPAAALAVIAVMDEAMIAMRAAER